MKQNKVRKKVPERNEGMEMLKETLNSGHGHWLGQMILVATHKKKHRQEGDCQAIEISHFKIQFSSDSQTEGHLKKTEGLV